MRIRATYRLQMHAGFTFDDAAEIVDYLAELGVSHVYLSPILQAAAGSTHGYDVVDHSRINAELGGEEGYDRFSEAMSEQRIGQVLDIVPNHMAIGEANVWWWDVLENGPASRWAAAFDIDWDTIGRSNQRVLLPFLGDHYGRVLEAGELKLERDGGGFVVRYNDHAVPISPRSLDELLRGVAEIFGSDDLASLALALGRLPAATATDDDSLVERHRDKEVLRRQLARLLEENANLARGVDGAVAATNDDPDALDALLERQNYRLAFWRTAGQELDYRRFFDVPTLIGLRIESRRIFAAAHETVLNLVKRLRLEGLRIDHIDGLLDPVGYLRRLNEESDGTYVVVEKIVERDEALPPAWPVAGTTGYDFLNVVGGLFVDPAGEEALSELYREVLGAEEVPAWEDVVDEGKHLILRDVLAADVNRVVNLLVAVCQRHRRFRDHTRRDLHEAVAEVLACFPVYRTYARPGDPPSAADVAVVEATVGRAAERLPQLDPELFSFLADLLLLRLPGDVEADFALRFQQITGPVMAKGVEDTAFYRYHRLVSLNDVGGDPGRFGTSVEEFHAHNAHMASTWPGTMLATSTHDTKRSEDVRARIGQLSEIPDRWADAVRRWTAMNVRHKTTTDDGRALPDANTEYLLYQTLVGAFPIDSERAAAYMEKATRRGQGADVVDRPRTGLRRRPAPVRRRDPGRRRVQRRPGRLRRAPRRPWADGVAGADTAQAHRPRRPRHVPGHRGVGPQPGRPRQPPSGRLRHPPHPAGEGEAPRRRRRAGARRRGGDQAVDHVEGAVRAPGAPGGVRGRSRPGRIGVVRAPRHHRRAGRPRGRLRPGREGRHRRPPPGPEPGPGRRVGRHRRRPAPRCVDRRPGVERGGGRREPGLGRGGRAAGAVPSGFVGAEVSHPSDDIAVWAPLAKGVELVVVGDGAIGERRVAMDGPDERGWFRARAAEIDGDGGGGGGGGSSYGFSLDGGPTRPDPRSQWQPDGVDGLSRAVDHTAFAWTDGGWAGRPLDGTAVIYELHVGTFSPEGTFDGAAGRLDHLADLGVDIVELLPVNQFPGRWGWGYDGVDLFAPHAAYGGPEGLKRLVDAAHARGLAVVIDVVYNHFGPAGNYLREFGPYFTDRYATPWGEAVNFDGSGSDEVRQFVVDNALMWLRDYHADGLRIDAVHAIVDTSAVNLLEEMALRVAGLAAEVGRPLFLVAESDLNDPRIVRDQEVGGYGIDAQWSDDFHHALHAVVTSERAGYYADFGSIGQLAKSLRQAFVHDGGYSPFRGRRHGRPPTGLPATRFLGYLQNHDQVGNRAMGERSSMLVGPGMLKVAAALVLLGPSVPMLFQGEEWGASTPFQYFTDHEDAELGQAVSEGRRREFAAFGWAPHEVPDPQSQATFERSKLDWDEVGDPDHKDLLDWHRRLIALRQSEPALSSGRFDDVDTRFDEDGHWLVVTRSGLSIVCNFADQPRQIPVAAGEVVIASDESVTVAESTVTLPPTTVAVLRHSA